MRVLAIVASMTFALLFWGCSDSSFSGSGSTKNGGSADAKKKTDDIKKLDAGNSNDTENSKDETDKAEVSSNGVRCLNKALPLRLLFLIDSTSSMDPYIGLVLDSVQQLSSQLKNIEFSRNGKSSESLVSEVKVGAISFRDAPEEQKILPFQDADSFVQSLTSVSAYGGGDELEGGLAAFKDGLDLIDREAAKNDRKIIPIVVMVSDIFSHLGGPGEDRFSAFSSPKRDCSTSGFNSYLRRSTFNNFLLYDATPNQTIQNMINERGPPSPGGTLLCAPYENQTVHQQWEDIRADWKESRPEVTSAPGRGLGFPFSASDLLSTLPDDVARSFSLCD